MLEVVVVAESVVVGVAGEDVVVVGNADGDAVASVVVAAASVL